MKKYFSLFLLVFPILTSCNGAPISTEEAGKIIDSFLTIEPTELFDIATVSIQSLDGNVAKNSKYVFSASSNFYYTYEITSTYTKERWEFVSIDGSNRYINIATRTSSDGDVIQRKNIYAFDAISWETYFLKQQQTIAAFTSDAYSQLGELLLLKQNDPSLDIEFMSFGGTNSLYCEANMTYETSDNSSAWPMTYTIDIDNGLLQSYYATLGSNYDNIGINYERISITIPNISFFDNDPNLI